jgi:thiol:disulfide interchange protein DsbD
VPAGGRFDVVLEVEVDAPYHIYAHDSASGLPTRVEAAPVDGEKGAGLSFVEVVQPEAVAQEKYDPVLEETLKTLEGGFEFRATFQAAADAQPGAREIEASITYMACDAKGCLFPVDRSFSVPVTVGAGAPGGTAAAPPSAGAQESAASKPRDADGPRGPDPVHVSVEGPKDPAPAGGRFVVVLRAEIDAPYHIFAHDSEGEIRPLRIEAAPVEGAAGAGIELERVVYPDAAAKVVRDEVLEETHRILEGTVEFEITFAIAVDAALGERAVRVGIEYQACNEQGCLFAVTKSEDVRVTVRERRSEDGAAGPAPAGRAPSRSSNGSLEESLSGALVRGDLGALLWLSLVFGFVSLLTPCVFPMIPITVSFFSKRASEAGGRGARFALAYGLGIMATYTGFGMAMAALLGASSLQALATNPWANLAIGALFVFFGLSLMGFYDLRPPAFLVRRAEGGVTARAGYAPVFVMGFIFTITAFTCTAPIVGSLLAALASGGSPVLIALGMLVYSAAFALPFVLLAAFPTMVQRLPGAGGWMVTVKVVLGFLELVAALKFLSNSDLVWDLQLLTRPAMLAVTLLLVAALALYLLGAYRLPHDLSTRRKLLSTRTLVAVGMLLAFLYLARGLTGRELDAWTESYLPPHEYGADQASLAPKDGVAWIEDFDAGLAQAKRERKRAFIDFTGITCQNCRKVEKQFFSQPRFIEASRAYVMIRAYTDRRSAEHRAHDVANQKRMASYGSVTLPFYVLLSPEGAVLNTSGYRPDFTVDWFLEFLETPAP